MDFKSFPPSKRGYNSILVIVNRLGKRLILVLYYKIIIAKDLASLFIKHV
jgi:hypothetical protein